MADQNPFKIRAPVQQQPGQLSLGQLGSSGGGVPGAAPLRQAPADTSTFDAFMAIGEQVVGRSMQKRQQQLFLEGAQRVAQGEALREVVDEQPWYSKIFGESASVQGARTIAQITQVERYNASLLDNMEELAKVSPDEIGKVVNGQMTEFLTGDPAADAVIQQKMVESSGQFYRAHAKAHVEYVQGNMHKQVADRMISAGTMLQSVMQHADRATDRDKIISEMAVTSSWEPLAGQTAESYWGAIETAALDALAQGNHHYVNLMWETGLIQEAPPEVRKKLIDERRKYEEITRKEAHYELAPQLGQINALMRTGQMSPREGGMAIAEMNERFARSTGITAPLMDRQDVENLFTANYTALIRAEEARREKAAAAATAAQAEAQKLALLNTAIMTGKGQLMVDIGGATQAEMQGAFYQNFKAMSERGVDWRPMVVESFISEGVVNPGVQRDITQGLRAATHGGEYTGQSFDRVYQQWKEFANSPQSNAARVAYYGAENDAAMRNYDGFISNNMPPERAFQLAFGPKRYEGEPLTKDEARKHLEGAVADMDPGLVERIFNIGFPLSDRSKDRLITEALPMAQAFLSREGGSIENALKEVLPAARARLDIVGGEVLEKSPAGHSFHNLIGSSEEAAGDVLYEWAKERIKAATGKNAFFPGYDNRVFTKDHADAVRPLNWMFGGMAYDVAKRVLSPDTADLHIIPSPTTSNEKGRPEIEYRVVIQFDGQTFYETLNSEEARELYETHPRFREHRNPTPDKKLNTNFRDLR